MTNNKALSLQVCGTGSGVGKSLIVTGLCRIFFQDGYRVVPFKAQNMALNSFVTKEEGEIGRAQATQAQSSRIEPTVDMNPVLIKPNSDLGAQIIVRGKPIGNMLALEYRKYKSRLKRTVKESFRKLAKEYAVVVIEGAGSPAEINLKRDDIVNLKMAEYAKAPVILVGDIDKGGVFAWIIGTLALLSKKERQMIKGIIINKFRGDKRLLSPGLKYLEKRTGIKILGVIPYFKNIRIPEEDSVFLEQSPKPNKPLADKAKLIDITIINLPHIANFTDFDSLENEPDVRLGYLNHKNELNRADLIIIPGTKNTIADLNYLKKSGIASQILATMNSKPTTVLIGICGGYQMLGKKIYDSYFLESKRKEIEGLNLLPLSTSLAKNKVLSQVRAKDIRSGREVVGYEIHHGSSKYTGAYQPFLKIVERNGKMTDQFDGIRRKDGRVLGTYIHGLFDSDIFRRNFLNEIRVKKRWKILKTKQIFNLNREFDKLATVLRENIDLKLLYKILKKEI